MTKMDELVGVPEEKLLLNKLIHFFMILPRS